MVRTNKEWAPCFHDSKDEEAEIAEYVKQVLSGEKVGVSSWGESPGIEELLWDFALSERSGVHEVRWGFAADQWVGVSVEVVLKDGTIEGMWTEGDNFTLAIAKTLQRLKDKYPGRPDE